jgi:hypothetical protein
VIRRKRANAPTLGPTRIIGSPGVQLVTWAQNSFYVGQSVNVAYTGTETKVGDLLIAYASSEGGTRTWNARTCSGLTIINKWAHPINTSGWVFVDYAWIPDDGVSRTFSVPSMSGNASGICYVVILRGVDPNTPFDVNPSYEDQASSSTPTFAGITTLTNKAWAFFSVRSSDDNSWTAPSGPTVIDSRNPTSAPLGVITTYEEREVGATGTRQFTETALGPDASQALKFAIRALAA